MEQKKNDPTFLRTHNAAGMWQNISKAMKGGAEIKWHLPITQVPPPPEVTWFVWLHGKPVEIEQPDELC